MIFQQLDRVQIEVTEVGRWCGGGEKMWVKAGSTTSDWVREHRFGDVLNFSTGQAAAQPPPFGGSAKEILISTNWDTFIGLYVVYEYPQVLLYGLISLTVNAP